VSRYLDALASLPESARAQAVAAVVDGYRATLGHPSVTEGALPEELRAVPVVASSPVGQVVGLAAAETFRELPDGSGHAPAVVVYVPCSGSSYVVAMDGVRPAASEEADRILREMEMAARVRAAEPAARMAGRSRKSKDGDERASRLVAMALDEGLRVEQAGGYHKVTGDAPGRAAYVSARGNRIDLSGFCVDHPAVRRLTDDEARAAKLGRVRGQVLDFSLDFEDAWRLALVELRA
jgi:hypothetical protein